MDHHIRKSSTKIQIDANVYVWSCVHDTTCRAYIYITYYTYIYSIQGNKFMKPIMPPTDREGNESRIVLYSVVLVQPTIRIEGERIFQDHWVHVTPVEIGNDQSAFGQIVASGRDRLADHVHDTSRGWNVLFERNFTIDSYTLGIMHTH